MKFLISFSMCILVLGFSSFAKAEVFPDFKLPGVLDGKEISLADLKGKTLLIDFWATWCAPCVESLPFYQQMQTDLQAQGFMVLGVNLDSELKDAQNFLKEHKISFANVHDQKKELMKKLGIRQIPISFIIDKAGNIVMKKTGFLQENKKAFLKSIQDILKPAKSK